MELRHLPGEVLALAGDPDGVDPIPSDLADNCNYWYRTANYYELLSTAKLLQLRGLLLGRVLDQSRWPSSCSSSVNRLMKFRYSDSAPVIAARSATSPPAEA
jgi:hypothetical protein